MSSPFHMFHVQVDRLRRLSPSFLRVTFTGDDLCHFADNGYDQRIKLVLPLPGCGLSYLPSGADWYQQWRQLDDSRRNPIRTYTARQVRAHAGELDVDVVMHPDGGPVARWAERVQPGDEAAILGPDARYDGVHGGLEFRLPTGGTTVLLAGDETAVPAICSVLERLPAGVTGEALMEVPFDDDALPVETSCSVRVGWLARNGGERGGQLVPAVQAAAQRLLSSSGGRPDGLRDAAPDADMDVDVDAGELWEVPQEDAADPLYAWLAGEAGVIKTLRRHLVGERGMDRRAVAFMGYWREGRAEGGG
ncbi:Vibriobactin utilization protein ViuB [Nonomuraea coxensis DSM 45129]|uniref:Vibriobactin utilization protein ViuB n=1 Tax=Nonomuraea coxensis DSM 45129 TaxID=1122611 RepID=A0ABX8U804_9ACTN|nr:siderophore-interacting protein [Nonomuraea coxensis]QYC42792.1 Vibriobactin utilization protein ViuB [Nonomuraea coxensis DSM 45129]